MLQDMLLKRVGANWDQAPQRNRNWWTYPALNSYMNRQISSEHETGVIGALRAAIGNRMLEQGVSVGCGTAIKERALLHAGLVGHFDLYEVSEARAREARAKADQEGLSDRAKVVLANAFKETPIEAYDLVYWDHALHHMFDVALALNWSVRALRPGGILLVNDYIGPSRLQWSRSEVARAREFVARNAARLGVRPAEIKPGTILKRLRLMWRDPSEAPQSDLIPSAYEAATGEPIRRLGGAMIHLCAGSMWKLADSDDPLFGELIDWDKQVLVAGLSHFGLGLWHKPR